MSSVTLKNSMLTTTVTGSMLALTIGTLKVMLLKSPPGKWDQSGVILSSLSFHSSLSTGSATNM